MSVKPTTWERQVTGDLFAWVHDHLGYGIRDVTVMREHTKELWDIVDAIECDIKEKFVALPLDRDNVPIHEGDAVESPEIGVVDTVYSLNLVQNKGWELSLVDGLALTPEEVRHRASSPAELVERFVELYLDEGKCVDASLRQAAFELIGKLKRGAE